MLLSVMSILMAAAFFLQVNVAYPDSVQVAIRWDELWRNSLLKQVTGFSILAFVVIGMTLSLRKRFKAFSLGGFHHWRLAHIVLGLVTLFALIAHTGMRMGEQFNFMLMLNFMLLAIVGAISSSVISTEHLQATALGKRLRARWTWIHILLVWPLPVLLGFHVLKSYYF
jgi:nitrite reductase (NADH) large subunit